MLYLGTSPVSRREDNGNWSQKRAEPHWNRKDGDSVSIRCFSNCDEVEVWVNGRSLGKLSRDSARNGIFNWNTIFVPGSVEAKGFIKGREVRSAKLGTAGAAAAIKVKTFSHPLIRDPNPLTQLEVRITDNMGNELYRPGNIVTVKVEGAASFAGMENSNLADTSDYRANAKPVINGPLIVYIKPDRSNRPYTVTLSSPGLPPAVSNFNGVKRK